MCIRKGKRHYQSGRVLQTDQYLGRKLHGGDCLEISSHLDNNHRSHNISRPTWTIFSASPFKELQHSPFHQLPERLDQQVSSKVASVNHVISETHGKSLGRLTSSSPKSTLSLSFNGQAWSLTLPSNKSFQKAHFSPLTSIQLPPE